MRRGHGSQGGNDQRNGEERQEGGREGGERYGVPGKEEEREDSESGQMHLVLVIAFTNMFQF